MRARMDIGFRNCLQILGSVAPSAVASSLSYLELRKRSFSPLPKYSMRATAMNVRADVAASGHSSAVLYESDGVCIREVTFELGGFVSEHQHESTCLICHLLGSDVETTIDDKTVVTVPGDVLRIPAGAKHSARNIGKGSAYGIVIENNSS